MFQKISNVCDIINGFTPTKSNPLFWENGTINWMTVDDINLQGKYISSTNKHITSKAIRNSNRIVPPQSTFICCTSATIGKVCINIVPMCSNQQFNGLVIKSKKLLDNEYLYYYCFTLKSYLLRSAGITTFPFVSVNKLGNFIIPIPPINEQHLIVSKIQKLESLIKEYK